MVFFSNAQGTNVQIVADPVNQGSTNANEVIFAGPFAPSNTVTVTYRTPGGISLTPRILSLVDGAQIIDGVEYNAWTGLLDAAVTEFAGTVTALFSITASEGTTIVTNPAYFEVHEGVYVEPPADPSADVWGKILTALTTVKESVDNVRKDTDDNTAAITAVDSVVSAHSTDIQSLKDKKLDKQTGETAKHMVYAKTPEGAQEMLPFPSGTLANIQDGDPDGSLEQLGANAQGKYDTALGTDNTTSVKGYYIPGVYFSGSQTVFTLDADMWPQITVLSTAQTPDETFTAPEWSAGDTAIFNFSRDVTLSVPIQKVDHNLLYIGQNLKNVVPTTRVENLRSNTNSVCVPSKPNAGITVLTGGASSSGTHNIAAGNNATVSGENNIAGGDCSDVGGIDCEGNATGAFVRGHGNRANSPYMGVFGKYAKDNTNGLGSTQPDEQILFRVGAGTSDSARSTPFAIDHNGTTTMRAAGVSTSTIVAGFNVTNKEYTDRRYCRNGTGNTTSYDGQFVAGKYSKPGYTGTGEEHLDSDFLVRIGNGTDANNRKTCFTIDSSGTVGMMYATGLTEGIYLPSHFITKGYADAHYAPIGGAYSAKEKPYTMTMEKTEMCIWDQAEDPVFDASTGLFVAKDYGGNIVERTLEQVVQNGTSAVPITFKPLYSTKKREETWGTMTDYYFPIWFSVTATENADGTVTLNGTMRYVAK